MENKNEGYIDATYVDYIVEPENTAQYQYQNGPGMQYQYQPPKDPDDKKWYQKTWFIILMLIIFWPVGICLMWMYADWHKVIKIVISVCIALSLISNLGTSKSDTYNTDTGSNDITVENSVDENSVDENSTQEMSADEIVQFLNEGGGSHYKWSVYDESTDSNGQKLIMITGDPQGQDAEGWKAILMAYAKGYDITSMDGWDSLISSYADLSKTVSSFTSDRVVIAITNPYDSDRIILAYENGTEVINIFTD